MCAKELAHRRLAKADTQDLLDMTAGLSPWCGSPMAAVEQLQEQRAAHRGAPDRNGPPRLKPG